MPGMGQCNTDAVPSPRTWLTVETVESGESISKVLSSLLFVAVKISDKVYLSLG